MTNQIERHNFFGLYLDDFGKEQLEEYLDNSLQESLCRVIYGYSLTVIPKFTEYPEIAEISNKFDLLTADGKGLFIFARLNGVKLNEHLSLPDIAEFMLDYANRKNRSLLLLGAKNEVNSAACRNVEKGFPGIRELHGIDGYFSDEEEDELLEKIKVMNPDIILIGISSPKKERLAEKMKKEGLRGIIVPCGGMIDVFAGVTKREPVIIKKLALSWLYRFIQEPRRLFSAVLLNGLKFLFVLFPFCTWNKYILRNENFSLAEFLRKE